MKKLKRAKSRVAQLIVALTMYLSYYAGTGSSFEVQFLSVLLGLFAGIGIAELLVNWAARFEPIRRFVVGQHFIEGYWDLRTEQSEQDFDNPANPTADMTNRGVMLIEYDHAADEHSVVVARLDANGNMFCTTSENCYMSETVNAVRYLNYFRIHDKRNSTMCVCSGQLFRVRKRTHPSDEFLLYKILRIFNIPNSVDTFSAVMYSPGSGARNQYATRIERGKIKEMANEQGSWIHEYLRTVVGP
ncbi:MAG: hypothetical protein AAF650_01585 [Pseudomonadota bacterium]